MQQPQILNKQDQVQTLINVLNALDNMKIEGSMSYIHSQIKDGIIVVVNSIKSELNPEKPVE